MGRIRVVRVLTYEGEEKWVDQTLARGAVPANGVKGFPDIDTKIESAIQIREVVDSDDEDI